jgi:glycosyltransferase involved in cell wall biosynthesis
MNEEQKILSVPEGVSRPLWSVMIPVYNRTKFVRQAVESVLAQDPGPDQMQIGVVDNSTESIDWKTILPPEILRRVEIFIHPKSLPVHGNWNTCIRKSNGHLIHILHDDDWVAKGFYDEIARLSDESPEAGIFAVRSFLVDECGVIDNVSKRFATNANVSYDLTRFFPYNPVQCPGVVVRRHAYEVLGGFKPDFQYVIDLEMWIRVVNAFGVRFSEEILSYYRISSSNGTHSLMLSGRNLSDMLSFCKWASLQYEPLKDVDWLDIVLLTAKRQELFLHSIGEMDASAVARKFWFENASTREKIIRLKDELKAALKRRLASVF